MSRRRQGGFTLLELLLVVAIIAVLVAIAFPLFAGVQRVARVSKAKADVRVLSTAVSLYSSHMGSLPLTLASVTTIAFNSAGATLGPHVSAVPVPPAGWSAYAYTPGSAGAFTISAAGDGTTVTAP